MKKRYRHCVHLFMGILFLMVGIPILAEPSYETKFSDWGNLLKQYVNDENGNEMIYARGKNGVITNKEVEQAMMFLYYFWNESRGCKETGCFICGGEGSVISAGN
ncbi:MAG: hypothetical protein ACLVCH_03365 [Roseburia inulinivorans]